MQPSFELFDHTADIGLRVRAPTLPQLLKPAADALYAVIGELVTTDDVGIVRFDLRGDEAALLLRDFLGQVLLLFECEARLIKSVEVSTFDRKRLTATARTAPIDHDRSVLSREVKAVTYHELAIRSTPQGYEATMIVDI